jgi:hypothetical protein
MFIVAYRDTASFAGLRTMSQQDRCWHSTERSMRVSHRMPTEHRKQFVAVLPEPSSRRG